MEELSLQEWLAGLDCRGMYDALLDQVTSLPHSLTPSLPLSLTHSLA